MAKPKPATPMQVAQFGHVAAALREAMKARDWSPGDLNEALGFERAYPGAYHWTSSKGALSPNNAKKAGKLLGIPPADLMRRDAPKSLAKAQYVRVTDVEPSPPTVSVSIRLTPELHRWLSIRALDTRSSIQQIVVDWLETERARETHAVVAPRSAVAAGVMPPGDVLAFDVDRTGTARIRLDASLPLEQAKPLLRMLLDAGIVFGNGEEAAR